MKLLLQYLKAFGVSWLTAMSGVFSVPFVALMTAFAGIWTAFNGDGHEVKAGAWAASGLWVSCDLAELRCRAIHPKAMPVILMTD